MSTTGALQVYGEACLDGINLAVDQINAAGGVLEGELRLEVADDQTSPQAGVDAAKRLVSIAGVSGIIGALSSGVTIPIATSVTTVEGVPQISPASTSPVITNLNDNDFLFRTVPSDALQGTVLADVVSKEGVNKVSVVYVNNDYGQGLAEAFKGAYQGEVASMVAYEEKQASYRGEISKAAQGDPEALVLIAYPGDGVPILRQSIEGGYFKNFIFTDGMKSAEVIEGVGAEVLDGAFGTVPAADPDSEASQRFRQMYEEQYGELPPQPFIDTAYDATMLMALAIEKAGSTDGKAVRDALREVAGPPGMQVMPGEFAKAKQAIADGQDVDYTGAAGPHDFDEHGDVAGPIAHWAIKDGKIVQIELIKPDAAS